MEENLDYHLYTNDYSVHKLPNCRIKEEEFEQKIIIDSLKYKMRFWIPFSFKEIKKIDESTVEFNVSLDNMTYGSACCLFLPLIILPLVINSNFWGFLTAGFIFIFFILLGKYYEKKLRKKHEEVCWKYEKIRDYEKEEMEIKKIYSQYIYDNNLYF